MRKPLPEHPLTLGERLILQNAVCALWHDDMMHDPELVQRVDPTTLSIPGDIFIYPPNAFHHDAGENVWVFEGQVRQMGVQPDGIEVIHDIQSFHMRAKRQSDGSFRIVFLRFEPPGQD